jgi:hypothetical protein
MVAALPVLGVAPERNVMQLLTVLLVVPQRRNFVYETPYKTKG